MAIVELDNGPSGRPRRGDGAVIAGLGVAITIFAIAMWATAPHPVVTSPAAPPSALPSLAVSSATSVGPITVTSVSVNGGSVVLSPGGGAVAMVPAGGVWVASPAARTLVLPPWANGVDLFEVPDRLTNENLLWTLRNVVHIRGGTGLASVEGPAVITWTENGFQYWMMSPSRSTEELVEIANGLR